MTECPLSAACEIVAIFLDWMRDEATFAGIA